MESDAKTTPGADGGGSGGGLGGSTDGGSGGGLDGSTDDATSDGSDSGGSLVDAAYDAPPPTNGIDDWPAFGHDPGRSFVSTDVLSPPLSTTQWTWSVSANGDLNVGHLLSLANLVSAGNDVFLHGEGDGPHDHVAGANNPNMKALSLATGMPLGSWSTMNDWITGDWQAATADKVIVDEDILTAVSVSNFMDTSAADIDGVCQIGDSDGEMIVDVANNRYYAFNRAQYHDLTMMPGGYCIPPGNMAAYDLGSGSLIWSNNLTKYPVTSAGHVSYAAGAVYFSVRYTPDGNGTPAGVAPSDGVYAFDAASGKQNWLAKPATGTTYGATSTDGTSVYVSAIVGGELKIVQLAAATGVPGWTSDSLGSVSSFGQSFEADPPAYLGGSVIVYTGASLTALDRATGKQQWSVSGLTGSVSLTGNHLAISGGSDIVYLTDATGLRAYKAADGSLSWSHDVTTVGNLASLILARGRALVFGDAGIVVLGP